MADDMNNVSDVSYGTTTRLKIIFIGNVAVGKTSIIRNMLNQKFEDDYEASVGVDFFSLSKKYKGKLIKIQMWDTAGQEKYKSLIPNYVRGAALVFLVYDISDRGTFEDLPNWLEFINEHEHTKIVLLANKKDLESKRKVTKEEGENFAKEQNLDFFEISAKVDQNLQNMLYASIASLSSIQGFNSERATREDIVNDLIAENEEPTSDRFSHEKRASAGQGFPSDDKKIEQTIGNEADKIDLSRQENSKAKKCAC